MMQQRIQLTFRFIVTAFIVIFLFTAQEIKAQQVKDSTHILSSASLNYEKSRSYQRRWGKHYRTEWKTPVLVKKLNLDTVYGGLRPYALGGGRQSTSLRLHDKNNREYVLRSIDKSFGNALPQIAQGTFIEDKINDQVTISHPYSAITIAPMADAAGILHTTPTLYYVPHQPALGKYNDSINAEMYILEKRPDEDWKTADNFANSENIIGTDKMLEKLLKDNDNSIDQLLFVRSRLFDMFIGDWARHEDQWRWAEIDKDKGKSFKPIPRDRDQAYSVFDGSYITLIKKAAGLKHLQSFDYKINDLKNYNFPSRNMDHHFTNNVTKEQWIAIALDLQKRLTDDVIENAVKQMPPEVFSISGNDIISKLKSRRNTLPDIAFRMYDLLADEIDITGSKDNEWFEINWFNDSVSVSVHKIKKDGTTAAPYYQRTFYQDQTKEIRLYGIDGNDSFSVAGPANKIKVRMIGGASTDNYSIPSNNIKRSVVIYDDRKNNFNTKNIRKKLSNDSSIHRFDYDDVQYSKKGFHPILSWNNFDRLHVGIGYSVKKQAWRKPIAMKHTLDLKYSISQMAPSITYNGFIAEVIGKADLLFTAIYDWERWTNYYGLGNDTKLDTSDRNFNRMRSKEAFASASFFRTFNKNNTLSITPYFEQMQIIRDTDRFIGKTFVPTDLYDAKQFAGAELGYTFHSLNKGPIPTKGFVFSAGASYNYDFQRSHDFEKYRAEANVLFPLISKFSVSVKAGGTTLTGTPQFFQYNSIGGSHSLRGHQRNRYYGEQTAYNQNELRWVSNFRSYLMNGKIGVFAFLDNGRVWLKNETSNTWHSGYGGGLLISPFNKFVVSVAYGISSDDTNFHLEIIKPF